MATVQFATLVYLAGLGELIAERSGVLNLGVEGMMAMGAVSGFMVAVATDRPWIGFLAAALVGMAVAGVHAMVSVVMGAGQVVSGLAITIGGLGFAAFIGQDAVRQRADAVFTDLGIAGLADIPWAGPILFNQPPVVYLAAGLGVAAWFVLNRTRLGLALRAVGESASTTDSVGHSVVLLRSGAVLVGGAFAGAAGAFLSLYMAAGWTEGLIAGRGWIAVALVIFGAWRPGRLAAGALLFGFTLALQPPRSNVRPEPLRPRGQHDLASAARDPAVPADCRGPHRHQLPGPPSAEPSARRSDAPLPARGTLRELLGAADASVTAAGRVTGAG